MRFWIGFCAVMVALGSGTPTVAEAGGAGQPMMALHVATYAAKNICAVPQLPSRCEDYVINSPSSGFFQVYVTISKYDSSLIAGAQFGIQYEGAYGVGCDVFGWRSCADLEYSSDSWPASGSGNLLTWEYGTNCQGDTLAYSPILVGAFELSTYSGDLFSLVPRPADGRAKVADCSLVEMDITDETPSRLGAVGFGTEPGYNPCLGPLTPVRTTTWGRLKTLYED